VILFVADVAIDDDALDARAPEPPQQVGHRAARLRHRHVADDEFVADDAERDRALLADHQSDDFREATVLRDTSGCVGA
jgi:hypothetical protein